LKFIKYYNIYYRNVFLIIAAPNIGVLILGRAIQGIGGGGVSVLVNIIIADIIPLRKRYTMKLNIKNKI